MFIPQVVKIFGLPSWKLKLLDNFEGKLTSSKYAKINKCSQDTAIRDIKILIEYGVISQSEKSGRSTSYSLILC